MLSWSACHTPRPRPPVAAIARPNEANVAGLVSSLGWPKKKFAIPDIVTSIQFLSVGRHRYHPLHHENQFRLCFSSFTSTAASRHPALQSLRPTADLASATAPPSSIAISHPSPAQYPKSGWAGVAIFSSHAAVLAADPPPSPICPDRRHQYSRTRTQ